MVLAAAALTPAAVAAQQQDVAVVSASFIACKKGIVVRVQGRAKPVGTRAAAAATATYNRLTATFSVLVHIAENVHLALQDHVYHHTLTPMLPASTTTLTITEHNSSAGGTGVTRSWTLPQSDVVPGEPQCRPRWCYTKH